MLQPFGLNSEHSNSLTTTLSKRPPLDSTSPMTKEQHHQYRQSVGKLLWLSLVRPDLQHAARDLSKHLVAPTQLDLQQLKHCLRYIKGTQHYQLHLCPQPPPGIHLPLAAGQQIPLLIEYYSDSDWAGDINTRQSTSGSLVTLLKNNMHSNSKTQQVIATNSAEAELYAISSTISDAIILKQLITQIENNIGIKTFDLNKHSIPTLFCFAILLLQQVCFNIWGSTEEQNTFQNTFNFAFCGFRICMKLGNLFFNVFQQRTTQQMLPPRPFQLLIFNGIFQLLVCKQMLPTKRGNTTTSSLSLTASRSRNNFKQL